VSDAAGDALAARFVAEAAEKLRDVYLPRLRAALATLPEADLWWRPHPRTTSVGTLLRHLEGNVRQWVVSGIGGAPDRRRRSAEFREAPEGTKARLFARLEATVVEACAVLRGLDARGLLARRSIQGFETDGVQAALHVVEHFGWHLGQVVWIAKMRAGAAHGLAFHDDDALDRRAPPAPGGRP
jgi:hypothetical protein